MRAVHRAVVAGWMAFAAGCPGGEPDDTGESDSQDSGDTSESSDSDDSSDSVDSSDSSDTSDTSGGEPETTQATLGPEGGELQVGGADRTLKVRIPAGALPTDVDFTLTLANAPGALAELTLSPALLLDAPVDFELTAASLAGDPTIAFTLNGRVVPTEVAGGTFTARLGALGDTEVEDLLPGARSGDAAVLQLIRADQARRIADAQAAHDELVQNEAFLPAIQAKLATVATLQQLGTAPDLEALWLNEVKADVCARRAAASARLADADVTLLQATKARVANVLYWHSQALALGATCADDASVMPGIQSKLAAAADYWVERARLAPSSRRAADIEYVEAADEHVYAVRLIREGGALEALTVQTAVREQLTVPLFEALLDGGHDVCRAGEGTDRLATLREKQPFNSEIAQVQSRCGAWGYLRSQPPGVTGIGLQQALDDGYLHLFNATDLGGAGRAPAPTAPVQVWRGAAGQGFLSFDAVVHPLGCPTPGHDTVALLVNGVERSRFDASAGPAYVSDRFPQPGPPSFPQPFDATSGYGLPWDPTSPPTLSLRRVASTCAAALDLPVEDDLLSVRLAPQTGGALFAGEAHYIRDISGGTGYCALARDQQVPLFVFTAELPSGELFATSTSLITGAPFSLGGGAWGGDTATNGTATYRSQYVDSATTVDYALDLRWTDASVSVDWEEAQTWRPDPRYTCVGDILSTVQGSLARVP